MLTRTRLTRLCAHLGGALLDFVYPPHCPACEAWQAPDDREALCPGCRESILAPHPDRCPRCAAPHADGATSGCPNCGSWPPTDFSRAVVATDFRGPVQAAIHALKFNGISEIGPLLGRLLASHPDLQALLADIEALVPVPLHPARQRERGFNQAELIARGAAEALGVPVRADLVRRRLPTRQQARLHADERQANLEGAFAPSRPDRVQGDGVPYRVIGLVDDVLTTGVTMSACAAALRRLAPGAPGAEIRAIAVASPFR